MTSSVLCVDCGILSRANVYPVENKCRVCVFLHRTIPGRSIFHDEKPSNAVVMWNLAYMLLIRVSNINNSAKTMLKEGIAELEAMIPKHQLDASRFTLAQEYIVGGF